jgi:acetylornithine deacetylase
MNQVAAIDARALARPLILLVTYGEELGSLGAQRLARQWPCERRLPERVIVGEPTSLRAVRMTKGHLKLRAVVRGRAAHSGFPHQGVNAIERAAEAVRGLASLRAAMEHRRVPTSDFFPDTPYPTLNVGRIRGGDAVNVIPGECELLIGLRLLPGMSSDEAVAETRAAIERAVGVENVALSTINDSPPMLLSADAPVYCTMCDVLGQSQSHGVPFSSDGGVLSRDLGLHCVLWGPGSIDVAHRADEYLPRADLDRADELLRSIIARFLFESQP